VARVKWWGADQSHQLLRGVRQLRRRISLARFHKVDSVAYRVEIVQCGRHCAAGMAARGPGRATITWLTRARVILVAHVRRLGRMGATSDEAKELPVSNWRPTIFRTRWLKELRP
jgi:hypothetical protein